MGVESAFVTRRFVFVKQTFTGHGVDDGHGGIVGDGRRFLVTLVNGAHNAFDVSTQF